MSLISQIQTPINALGVRATSLESATWSTVLDLDLSAHSNLTMASDTTYSITDSVSAKTWTKINSAADSVAMAIVNGTGLQLKSTGTIDWTGGGSSRTMPGITIPVTSLLSTFTPVCGARLWVYQATDDLVASGSFSFFYPVLYCGTAATGNTDFLGGRLYSSVPSQQTEIKIFKNGTSGTTTTALTHGSGNRVTCLVVPNLLQHRAQLLYGAWASGWPAVSALTCSNDRDSTTASARANDGTTAFTIANWLFGLVGGRVGSAVTSGTLTTTRVRLDLRLL